MAGPEEIANVMGLKDAWSRGSAPHLADRASPLESERTTSGLPSVGDEMCCCPRKLLTTVVSNTGKHLGVTGIHAEFWV